MFDISYSSICCRWRGQCSENRQQTAASIIVVRKNITQATKKAEFGVNEMSFVTPIAYLNQ